MLVTRFVLLIISRFTTPYLISANAGRCQWHYATPWWYERGLVPRDHQ